MWAHISSQGFQGILTLINLSLYLIKYNKTKYKITAITILITLKQSYLPRTYPTNNNIADYPDYNHKTNNWKFHSKILKTKNSCT